MQINLYWPSLTKTTGGCVNRFPTAWDQNTSHESRHKSNLLSFN